MVIELMMGGLETGDCPCLESQLLGRSGRKILRSRAAWHPLREDLSPEHCQQENSTHLAVYSFLTFPGLPVQGRGLTSFKIGTLGSHRHPATNLLNHLPSGHEFSSQSADPKRTLL